MARQSWDERRLWAFSAILYGALVAEVVLLFAIDTAWGRAGVGAVVAEIFSGREGGIPVAISAGIPPLYAMTLSVTQDLAAFFLTYPIFLWMLHRHHDRDNRFMRRVRRIERAAERHQAYIRRWGPVGVGLFMLVPFMVNGPLVAGIAGRLAGIPTRRLLLPITLASIAAAAAWAFFFDQTIGRIRDVDPRIGYAVAGAIVIGLLASGAYALVRDERRDRAELAARPAGRASTDAPLDAEE